MLYPLIFRPILKERIWGGRTLQALYGKALPAGRPIGESWEVSDRPEDSSVVANGPLAGRDLHWLVDHYRRELLGSAQPHNGRFPLLIKILDAREKLSLQVHPPAFEARRLRGEPKTEMWYIADAAPGSELYVGLRRGTTRAAFEENIRQGTVSNSFHRVKVRAGDAMFLPSGRVHAIGAGLVIFEIQQNSDTTYRVFDWNRVGLDGKPRQLHVAESLASIDFNDFEPALVVRTPLAKEPQPTQRLVSDLLFTVDLVEAAAGANWNSDPGVLQILGLLEGGLAVSGAGEMVRLNPGEFCLLPASIGAGFAAASAGAKLLRVFAGEPRPPATA
ncbi:MAG TPA: type I phosphomannose isomerase catalytic subunit [Verrucomicrobiae bacterium]